MKNLTVTEIDKSWEIKHPIKKSWLFDLTLINIHLPNIQIRLVNTDNLNTESRTNYSNYYVFYKNKEIFSCGELSLCDVKQMARKFYEKELK